MPATPKTATAAFAQPHVPINSAPNRQTRHLQPKPARLAELAPPLKPAGLATADM